MIVRVRRDRLSESKEKIVLVRVKSVRLNESKRRSHSESKRRLS